MRFSFATGQMFNTWAVSRPKEAKPCDESERSKDVPSVCIGPGFDSPAVAEIMTNAHNTIIWERDTDNHFEQLT